jgi:hypothetical protein
MRSSPLARDRLRSCICGTSCPSPADQAVAAEDEHERRLGVLLVDEGRVAACAVAIAATTMLV